MFGTRIACLKVYLDFTSILPDARPVPAPIPEDAMDTVTDLPQMIDLEDETRLPFLVHYTAKTRFSRLHRVGGCRRRPGRELKEVTYHATISEAPYMAYCTDCWPNTVPIAESKASSSKDCAGLTAEDSVSNSSSSTESS